MGLQLNEKSLRKHLPREDQKNKMAERDTVTESSMKLNLPEYGSNVQTWFNQLNAIFSARRITSQASKYAYVVEKLPTEVATEVSDLLTNMPVEKPYEVLKDAILCRTGFSEERKLRELFTNVTLGTSKPSQLLRKMRTLLGTNTMSDAILQQLWFDKLKPNMIQILASLPGEIELQKLSEIADKIAENEPIVPMYSSTQEYANPDFKVLKDVTEQMERLTLQVRNIQDMVRRSRNEFKKPNQPHERYRNNRSYSRHRHKSVNAICWYHRRFGSDARKCTQPCNYKKSSYTGNDYPGSK